MTRHKDSVTLRQILGFSADALAMVEGLSVSDLGNDRKTRYALLHLICVIGEASNRLSEECRAQHTNIPWRDIIGMRNRLIHGYDVVSMEILWDTITVDIKTLHEILKEIVDGFGD